MLVFFLVQALESISQVPSPQVQRSRVEQREHVPVEIKAIGQNRDQFFRHSEQTVTQVIAS